ncbi:DUF1566 domain-containing protein [Kiritimatiellota bacterium B12222]|nr:DUF1566 domain-containing protein [Kiritimatiellota bacterium B12222]
MNRSKVKKFTTWMMGILVVPAMATELNYLVVDSAQIHCYDDEKIIDFPSPGDHYYGQDAQFSVNPPSYLDQGDGTISDQVTGLMWTQDPGEKMTWAQAVAGAKTCRIGGYTDWRLPTVKELYSLINFNGIDPDPMATDSEGLTPFIDRSVFNFKYGDPMKGERIIDSQWATSTLYQSTTMGGNQTMFGVNFADGRIKGYPVTSRRGETLFYTLYVRGNPDYGKNKFTDNGDGTVTDEATGLMWMQSDSGMGMDWPSALEYAEKQRLAGYGDWRLPSVKELQSLVEYSRSPDSSDSAAIDPVFECTEIQNEKGQKDFAQYWSSTTHISSRGVSTAAYVAFGRAMGYMRNQWMDVHGAGCQRSDPKTGDASRFPKGRGPQGDAIHIDNMVRLVRGGTVVTVVEEPADVGNTAAEKPVDAQVQRPEQASGFMMREDKNGDGKVARTEFRGPPAHFDHLDKNGDGWIMIDEAPSGPVKRSR